MAAEKVDHEHRLDPCHADEASDDENRDLFDSEDATDRQRRLLFGKKVYNELQEEEER